MKKLYTIIIVLWFIATSAMADSYHTIAIDGQNSGWAANEVFTNISHDGSAQQAYAHFTWDENYIYIGISDPEADEQPLATFIYFDSDPTGNNGTTDAYAWDDYMTTPFNSDYVVIFKNQSGDDYIEVKEYNGSTWEFIPNTSMEGMELLSSTGDTLVKFRIGSDYREVEIKRSMIGSPDQIKTCMFTERRDSYWRYLTWPSNGWVDANRAYGQAIPNYYGFILNEDIHQNDAPYYDCKITGFTGDAKSTSWDNASNWSNGMPDDTAVVIIPAASIVEANTAAECYDLSVATGANLTVSQGNSLTVYNNLYSNSGLTIESTSAGNGSLIVHGEASGDVTAQCYMTDGQWHSYSAPVQNLTAEDLYLGGNPEVWLAEYDEATKEYTFISAYEEPLGDMKGWMTWIETSSPNTFSFEGPMHTGTIGSTNNLIRSQAGDYGYNYVGNPYTSAIDWDTTAGWTKTNLNDAIYVFNDTSWSSYVDNVGVNDGSRYIAMNQGFMVQVTDNLGPYPEYGTLQMNDSVCLHNSVSFLKTPVQSPDSLIRLQLDMYGATDETVIRFIPDATEGYDGNYDAHKMFSYSDNKPLIYSTANNGMSINSLPPSVTEIPLDVQGNDNASMTIKATEINTIDDVYLIDNLTGDITDLKTDNYSFRHDITFPDRFVITSLITDINNPQQTIADFIAWSANNSITIKSNNENQYNYNIYNIQGQLISSGKLTNEITIPVYTSGCYIINLWAGQSISSKKVIVK